MGNEACALIFRKRLQVRQSRRPRFFDFWCAPFLRKLGARGSKCSAIERRAGLDTFETGAIVAVRR